MKTKDGKRVEHVSTRTRIEKLGVKRDADVLLLGIADDVEFLKELRGAGANIRTAGTLRPKGSQDLAEREMMRAGQAAGLVDVKVVSFSDVLTAEKFVVPVAKRRAHPAGR